MKKLVLSILIMSSIIFLSACTQDKISQTDKPTVDQNENQKKEQVILDEGPNGTRTLKQTYPDGVVEDIKETYKEGVLLKKEVTRTYPDGEVDKYTETSTESKDGKITTMKRTFENGEVEDIIIEKVSENKEIRKITKKRFDGTTGQKTEEVTHNPDGTITLKRTLEDGSIETETYK